MRLAAVARGQLADGRYTGHLPAAEPAVAIRSAGEGGHGDCWSFTARKAGTREAGRPVTAGRFRHVLVGWDASADAAEALSAAASIAGDEGHVWGSAIPVLLLIAR